MNHMIPTMSQFNTAISLRMYQASGAQSTGTGSHVPERMDL